MNLTCNSTLEEMMISPGSEVKIAGPLNFHDLARIIAAGSTLISVVLSSYLIWMHATHYTQPREQRFIIRILFMVPVYSITSFMQIQWYWHAIYFNLLGSCIEAFVLASFYGLICHYCAPDLHTQKEFFRHLHPIKPWVMPINWLAKWFGGEKGPWRTPKSGLTWFNIIWISVYQYCFILVAMTATAVITQHFHKYCESSNSPVFAHVWVLVINAVSVTIAMYCLIQFYLQLTTPLAEHKLFIKILAIKLVVFLSFWQSAIISLATSGLNLVHANDVLAYPDIKVGIPSLLLCVEMTLLAVLHIWAFPYQIYRDNAGRRAFYPDSDPLKPNASPIEKRWGQPSGGFLGIRALMDACNPWDFVKGFGRGMRWLFVGVKKRKQDVSYMPGNRHDDNLRMDDMQGIKSADPSPHFAALQDPTLTQYHGIQGGVKAPDESVGLISHAQPNPLAGAASPPSAYTSTNPYRPAYADDPVYDPPPYGGAAASHPYESPSIPRPSRSGSSPSGRH
ncbi:Transmembrane protein 184-like protein [Escovopsis weberi]|uniref:Transmembrane protein 184-like protein n=1 Tax=Escovopsis weberi TaxID=150374 RepID=A0A0M8N096_ESCWE|nr:Transmembrane protein 184-like protein [Escovopsis weberi]